MDRPGDRAAECQIVRRLAVAAGSGEVLGEPEIQQLHQPAGGQEDVARGDVPMDDATVVRRSQCIGDLPTDIDHRVERQRPAQQAGLQARALEQFHGDERLRFVVADIENRADVRMVQRRGEPRLALEAPDRIAVAREVVLDDLDGDRSRQPRVLRLVDDAHAAGAQRANDVEVRQLPADHEAPTVPPTLSPVCRPGPAGNRRPLKKA